MTAAFNPFPGLRPFNEAEGHLFFGRSRQIDELIELLATARFIAVMGTSGSGKTSLVRAGLLPALHGGLSLRVGSRWHVATLRPGSNPMHNLAGVLAELPLSGISGETTTRTAQVESMLRRSAFGLADVSRLVPDGRLLVIADQFEELFRFHTSGNDTEGPDDAPPFAQLLVTAAQEEDTAVNVIITMRSDYLGDCAQFRDLPEAINRGLYLVPRLSRAELREAMTAPVAVGGGEITHRLVQRLLNDAATDPDILPIVQHALMRTWDLWPPEQGAPRLDLPIYEATGGAEHALARHADEAYDELADEGLHRIAELAFKRLTELGADRREVRRPTPIAELVAVTQSTEDDVRRVLKHFSLPGRSFLTESDDGVVDISHESLIRQWPRLRRWVREEADSRDVYRRLADAASRRARGEAALLHNPDLPIATRWWTEAHPNPAWAERYDPRFEQAAEYLDLSRRAAKRRRRWAAVGVAALVVLTFASVLLASLASRASGDSAELARQARARELAGASRAALGRDPDIAMLLALGAVAADRAAPQPEAIEALYAAVESPWRATFRHDDAVFSVHVSAAGDRVVTASRDGTAVIWDEAGSKLATLQHEDTVNVARFDPDGKRIVTASNDGTARLWTADGALLARLEHDASVSYAEFSPTGCHVVTADRDLLGRLFDCDGRLIKELPHGHWVRSARFSRDGSLVVTASRDGTAAIWDLEGEQLAEFQHGHPLSWADFDATAERVVTAADDGTVRVWDRGGTKLGEVSHDGKVGYAEFHPTDRGLLTASDDGTAVLWDTDYQRVKRLLHAGDVATAQFDAAGEHILTASRDGTARLWDRNGDLLAIVDHGTAEAVFSAIFAGSRIATASGDGTARLSDLDRALLGSQQHDRAILASAFSPLGPDVATASSDDTARVWRPGTEATLLRHAGDVYAVAFDPGGTRIVTGSEDGTARLWDIDGAQVSELVDDDGVVAVEFDDSGEHLLTASGTQATIWTVAGERVGALDHDARVVAAHFSPDGDRVLTAAGPVATLWDPETGETVELQHDDQVVSARFSADGEILTASGSVATLWSDRGELLEPFDHGALLSGAASGPRGDILVTFGEDSVARVWDAAGSPVATLRHGGWVLAADFDTTGELIITASDDDRARVWTVSGRLLATFEHQEAVSIARFDPAGGRVLTASRDGDARLWRWLDVDQAIEAAQGRIANRQFDDRECVAYVNARCSEIEARAADL